MIFEGLFEKSFDENEILNALSKIFNLSRQNIFVTNDIYHINDELDENIEILCEKTGASHFGRKTKKAKKLEK